MNQDRNPNTDFQFNLRFIFAAIAFFALILSIPIVGTLLFSGMIGILVVFGLLVAVQFPIFILIRRWLNRHNESLEEHLQQAIEHQDTPRAIRLIEQGADIHEKVAGSTALAWAVTFGNIELTKYLLSRCADIRTQTPEGDLIETAEFGKSEAHESGEKRQYDNLIEFLKSEMDC